MGTIQYTRVSRNIVKGEPISDVRELATLAKDKKAVVVALGKCYMVKPAAVLLNWSLNQLMNAQLFYSIKITPSTH